MKRCFLMISAMLLALLLSACGADDAHEHDIPWRTALMDNSLPDGPSTPDAVTFCYSDEDDKPYIENVSFSDISDFVAGMEHLPRTDYFNGYLSEGVRSIMPVLDYALCHGCSKLCVPTSELDGSELFAYSRWLGLIYHVNDSGITGRTVTSFENSAGETVNYIFIAFGGMDRGALASHYREALAEAQRIVDTVPKSADEVETALYLYKYLTDNVRYDYDDYYINSSWDLLYDALIRGKTVCAGYEEALYTLYNLAGIECFSVTGGVYGTDLEDYGGGHIWSIARLNGDYYEFDPTWDEGVDPEHYRFFAVSTEEIQAYYPRVYDAITEEYAPPRTKTLDLENYL